MTATYPVGDTVTDGRYSALPDPTTDRMMSVIMAMAAELWTVRDRLRLVEDAAHAVGIELSAAVEDIRNTDASISAMKVDRDAFVERVFGALTDRADVEAP